MNQSKQELEEILMKLTALLSASSEASSATGSKNTQSSKWQDIPFEEDNDSCDDGDYDFSSFPSLSLAHPQGSLLGEEACSRSAVESRVASLLAKPILASHTSSGTLRNEEEDELDCWIAESLADVPEQMLQNLSHSFATLVESRLCTYYKFLLRHWQCLSEATTTAANPVVIPETAAVDQSAGKTPVSSSASAILAKMEKLHEIGSCFRVHKISTSFAPTKDAKDGSAAAATSIILEEDGCTKVTQPIVMTVNLHVSLTPSQQKHENGNLKLTFSSHGTLSGLFGSSPTKNLRAIELALETHELLSSMIEQTSPVISLIVDMTNQAYVEELNSVIPSTGAVISSSNKRAREPALIESSPASSCVAQELDEVSDFMLDEHDSDSTLSRKECEGIVDMVIGQVPTDIIISGPPCKRLRQTVIARGATSCV